MTQTERFKPFAAVWLLLVKNEKVLLLRRYNTGYKDGYYTLAVGHMEEHEGPRQALIREAAEEVSVNLKPENVHLALTMYRHDPDREYVDFYFTVTDFDQKPCIGEPHLCDHMDWFSIDALPEKTVHNVVLALEAYRQGKQYAEFVR